MFSDRHKVEILKVCFFDAERCRCHCDVSNMHKCTLFFDGTETVVYMFICASKDAQMHKCTNAQFLAFDGTPSEEPLLLPHNRRNLH